MILKKIKINGFKSFTEPVEIPIKDGLTGIIGPNGCGKSNILEAIRWAMGENSYKNMRAQIMDDVIFSGTQNKPQRNIAEVIIVLDNQKHTAPTQFNHHNTIEISRKIERDLGSVYQLNKKNVRARDIITLFADAATGARSASLVAQGEIAQIIADQPKNRAKLLEQAAGITGIHTRRHETEIKIKATKTNLIRIKENTDTIKIQLKNLNQQARQAVKYKKISENIRYLELKLIYNQYLNEKEKLNQHNQILNDIQKQSELLTQKINRQDEEKQKKIKIIQNLTQNLTKKQTKIDSLNNEKITIREQQKRQQNIIEQLENQLKQIRHDIDTQRENKKDAENIIKKRNNEKIQIIEKNKNEKKNSDNILQQKQHITQKKQQYETEINQIQQKINTVTAQKNTLINTQKNLQTQLHNLEIQKNDINRKYNQITDQKTENLILKLQKDAQNAQNNLEKIEKNSHRINQDILEKRERENNARKEYLKQQNEADQCKNQIRNSENFLRQNQNYQNPILNHITVTQGYEKALAAALKDELNATTNENDPAYWTEIKNKSQNKIPENTEPLEKYVNVPPQLKNRLQNIALVKTENAAEIQKKLAPGQKIISLNGDMWRWDGYITKHTIHNPTQKKLEEKNTLEKLKKNLQIHEQNAKNAKNNLQKIQKILEQTLEEEKNIRENHTQITKIQTQTLEKLNQYQKQNAENQKQKIILKETQNHIETSIEQCTKQKKDTDKQINALDNLNPIREILQQKNNSLNQIKKDEDNQNNQYQKLIGEIQYREQRINHINTETEEWNQRYQKIINQIHVLNERLKKTQTERQNISDTPEQYHEKIHHIENTIQTEEKHLNQIKTEHIKLETQLNTIRQEEKNNQNHHLKILEERARIQERINNIQENKHQTYTKLTQKIPHGHDDPENAARTILNAQSDNTYPNDNNPDNISQKLEKAYREREKIGAVNLIAEQEAQKIQKKINTLENEYQDLTQALEKLQNALSQINRQGKEKLQNAFEIINTHFQQLFRTLFAGGQAKLIMTNTQDPLETELEIIAQPPGKKNQSISLLSGGEQTLTAIALTFALFLTNPSPICALDEIDAPLDDANVERFCSMLNDIQQKTKTRFLIITHHPYTMSKMHQLYGVTMIEKGISRLVSVSLETAQQYAQ